MGILHALLRRAIRWTALAIGFILALLRALGLRRRPEYFLDWQSLREPDQPAPPSSFDLVGHDLTSIMFAYIDAEAARKLLPEGLVLDPPPGTPVGKHPALYSFNYHREIRPYFLPWPTDSYLESLFGLSYVRIQGDPSGPYSVMTDLRLNDVLATVLGLLEGYPKHLARIRTTVTEWTVSKLFGGSRLFTGSFRPAGLETMADELGNFEKVRPMLEQLVVSKNPAGHFVISGFRINFSTAIVQPLEVEVNVDGAGLPGLGGGKHVFRRIDKTPDGMGAFRSLHAWQTVTPLPVVARRVRTASAGN